MEERNRHAPLPVFPPQVRLQLEADAEELPKTRLVIGYVPVTQSILFGRCHDGIVTSWNCDCPVGVDDVALMIEGLKADEAIRENDISFRQFDYAPEGRLN